VEQNVSGENLCYFLLLSFAVILEECQPRALTAESLDGQSTLRTVRIPRPGFSYLFQTCQLGCQPGVIGGAQRIANNKQYFWIFNDW